LGGQDQTQGNKHCRQLPH